MNKWQRMKVALRDRMMSLMQLSKPDPVFYTKIFTPSRRKHFSSPLLLNCLLAGQLLQFLVDVKIIVDVNATRNSCWSTFKWKLRVYYNVSYIILTVHKDLSYKPPATQVRPVSSSSSLWSSWLTIFICFKMRSWSEIF